VIKSLFSEFLLYFLKTTKTSFSNRNSSPNRLGCLLMLGANYSLCVFGIGFQLYGQLKKSLHNGIGVLDRSAISIASQTTRLGKGSSVTTQDKHMS